MKGERGFHRLFGETGNEGLCWSRARRTGVLCGLWEETTSEPHREINAGGNVRCTSWRMRPDDVEEIRAQVVEEAAARVGLESFV